MRRRFAILTAGGIAAVLAVAGIAGVAAQTASPTPSPEEAQSNPLSSFVERLAANLGIGPDELTSAVEQTRDEMVDEAVANGDLTPERGEALKDHDLGDLLERFGDSKGHERRFDWAGPNEDGDRPFRHGPFGFGGPGMLGGGPGMLAEAADLIGIDLPTLLQEVSGGKSLAEVAVDHGVSRDELKQGLLDDYSASLDELLDYSFNFGFHDGDEDSSPTPSVSPSATPGS
jgi:hypothetical protein